MTSEVNQLLLSGPLDTKFCEGLDIPGYFGYLARSRLVAKTSNNDGKRKRRTERRWDRLPEAVRGLRRQTGLYEARTTKGKTMPDSQKTIDKLYLSQMGRNGRIDIPRGDDETFNHHLKKNRYLQVVAGFLKTGTTAISFLEVDQDGSMPQVKGGVVNTSDRNEIIANFTVLPHDKDLVNKTSIFKIDDIELWMGRKLIDLATIKIDPKNLLNPVVGVKTGQHKTSLINANVHRDPPR